MNLWQEEWERRGIPQDEWPVVVGDGVVWEVLRIRRRTAWDNRPGLKMFYVRVFDENVELLGNVHIEFETEPPDTGVIFDHPDIWGRTGTRRGREGYAEWEHYGVPTRYEMWVECDELAIQNLRTDLGNEYPTPPGSNVPSSHRPTNRPGIYSYDIWIAKKRQEQDKET